MTGFQQGFDIRIVAAQRPVLPATGFCQLLQCITVQPGHHQFAGAIAQEATTAIRYRRAFLRTDTQYRHRVTLVAQGCCDPERTRVIKTVGDQQDIPTRQTCLFKQLTRPFQAPVDTAALHRHQCRRQGFE